MTPKKNIPNVKILSERLSRVLNSTRVAYRVMPSIWRPAVRDGERVCVCVRA